MARINYDSDDDSAFSSASSFIIGHGRNWRESEDDQDRKWYRRRSFISMGTITLLIITVFIVITMLQLPSASEESNNRNPSSSTKGFDDHEPNPDTHSSPDDIEEVALNTSYSPSPSLSPSLPPTFNPTLSPTSIPTHVPTKSPVVDDSMPSNTTEDESMTEYDPNLFQGDIIPTWATIESVYGSEVAGSLVENGIMDEPTDEELREVHPNLNPWNDFYSWRDLYVIYVYIDVEYRYKDYQTIKTSLRNLARRTEVIRFKILKKIPTDGRPYLHVATFGMNRCASYVGMTPFAFEANGQPMYVGTNCMTEGIIQHHALHALGFYHENSRSDRDNYVDIYDDNIKEGYEDQFQKTSNYDSLGCPYDYDSLLHYSSSVFSKDGDTTIGSKGYSIGQRIKMSRQDVLRIRLMYQCKTGPRRFDTYKANRCTKECKCGKNWKGCGSSNLLCKGKLQCVDNLCVAPPESL